ncbi:anne boleyn [Carabus blaptoides fortunei]
MGSVSRENLVYQQIGDETYQILNHSCHDEIILHIYGFKQSKVLRFIYHLVSVLLLGIPYLVCSWYPHLNKVKLRKCSLRDARVVLLKDNHSHSVILQVHTDIINVTGINEHVRYFDYQHVKYIWRNEQTQFAALVVPRPDLTLNDLLDNSSGLTHAEQQNALKLYGPNVIRIEVKSYLQLFVQEVFNPFYLFQIFSITLWSCDEYYIYAGCILFLSLVSIVTSLYETKKQSKALHNLVDSSNCTHAQVCRPCSNPDSADGSGDESSLVLDVDAGMLVPGDLIAIPANGCVMPCDAVLLSGNCIVNESMLTGESVPVTKTPPNHSTECYSVDLHKRFTLFAGTHVIQTRFYGGSKVLARVIRTGFNTSKGELIKSILYPKPMGIQFYRDSMKMVAVLAVIATAGMVYCVYLYVDRHADIEEICIRALDIITVVVPPALPAAMTVGTIYSQNRLKKLNIFCISPPRINVCGKLKLICFDKTGTLTQDGLDFYGVLPAEQSKFHHLVQEPWTLSETSELLQAMATCHSLTRIDNELTGDPLDLSMFAATRWDLEEPGDETTRYDMLAPTVVKPTIKPLEPEPAVDDIYDVGYEIGIIRQFPFSSSQQCMSVICRILGAVNMTVFTKGAPEKVYAMCTADSVPKEFATVLSTYTTSGYRVIALAYKHLPRKLKWKDAQKIKRDVVECDLTLLGFIIMQNALKPETTPIINELHSAKIRTVMVTGDNVMTAISVSRDCGMVLPNENIALLKECTVTAVDAVQVPRILVEVLGSPTRHPLHQNGDCVLNFENNSRLHIAMDGKTWSILRAHYPDLIPRIVLHGTIFARFRPEQKTQLVTSLQELDYIVAMCGDGANDCGALKAAHIGVSLSQAEASVAAPFTSANQNIACVKHLVSEGRCALVTSFAVFKYMALYSLIQFFTILILYKRYTTLGNMQFLYIDLIITTTLAVTMGYQGPAHILVAKRPMGSLVSLVNLIPLFLQIILCGIIKYGALYYLQLQPWFSPLLKSSYHGEEVIVCWENTIVFSVSLLLFAAVALTIFTTVLLVYPVEPLAAYFEMIPVSKSRHQLYFRLKILIFPLVHFILAVFIEVCIGQRRFVKHIAHCLTRKTNPKNKYKQIEQSAADVHSWLDVCTNTQHSIHC